MHWERTQRSGVNGSARLKRHNLTILKYEENCALALGENAAQRSERKCKAQKAQFDDFK